MVTPQPEFPKKVTLDDPALRSRTRLQLQPRPTSYTQRPVVAAKPTAQPLLKTPAPEVAAQPARLPIPELHEKLPTMPVPVPQPVMAQTEQPRPGFFAQHRKAILTTFFVIALSAGALVGINSLRTNRYVSAQLAHFRKTTDSNAPSEDQPSSDEVKNYSVPNNDPRLLRIQKLGIVARVQKLGVTANNQLALPNNVYDVGWYEGSSRPDEAGALLVDGYVQGASKSGAFKNIATLSVGDEITMERGDGQQYSYRVAKIQTYPASQLDMGSTLQSVDANKKGLNLISSSGQYDANTKNYKERLVVFAVQE